MTVDSTAGARPRRRRRGRRRRGGASTAARCSRAGRRATTTTTRSGRCAGRRRSSPRQRRPRRRARVRRGAQPDRLRDRPCRRARGARARDRRDRAARGRRGHRGRAARARGRAPPRARRSRSSARRSSCAPASRWRAAGEREPALERLVRRLPHAPASSAPARWPPRRRSEVAALGESVGQRLGSRAAADADGGRLTRRELEVVRLLAVGRTNREIAAGAVPQPAHRRHARAQHPAQARLPLAWRPPAAPASSGCSSSQFSAPVARG